MRELPITACTVRTEEDCLLALQYSILVEETTNGLEYYGIKITEESTSDSAFAFCLTIYVHKIYDFINRLAKNTVTPTGLIDVVDDWLE